MSGELSAETLELASPARRSETERTGDLPAARVCGRCDAPLFAANRPAPLLRGWHASLVTARSSATCACQVSTRPVRAFATPSPRRLQSLRRPRAAGHLRDAPACPRVAVCRADGGRHPDAAWPMATATEAGRAPSVNREDDEPPVAREPSLGTRDAEARTPAAGHRRRAWPARAGRRSAARRCSAAAADLLRSRRRRRGSIAGSPTAAPRPTTRRRQRPPVVRPTTAPIRAPSRASPDAATPNRAVRPNDHRPCRPAVVATAAPCWRVAAAPVAGQPLIDVRFASGPKPGWLDNPPFASWSDGAYRLQALAADALRRRRRADRSRCRATWSSPRPSARPADRPAAAMASIVRDQSPEPAGRRQPERQRLRAGGRRPGRVRHLAPRRRSLGRPGALDALRQRARPAARPTISTVRAIGDRLTFSVNGIELASVQDATLPAGGVGVFVGGDYNEVALDRLRCPGARLTRMDRAG